MMKRKKVTVGLTEEVIVIGKRKVKATAKFDTGAARTSVDEKLADEAGLAPIIKWVRVRSSSLGHRYQRRPVVRAKLIIKDKKINAEVNISDRSHFKNKVLIGRDVIFGNFIIDIEKTHNSHREEDVKNG